MKKKTKLLSILLSCAMILSLCAVMEKNTISYAEETSEYVNIVGDIPPICSVQSRQDDKERVRRI